MDERPAVFIDRDGTVIKQIDVLTDPSQLELLPGVGEAIADLNRRGFLVIAITNQPIIEKGLLTMASLDAIHSRLQEMLSIADAHIDGFFTCPHRYKSDQDCECRKPNPGLIREAQKKFPIDIGHSWLVGDRLRDIETGNRIKLKTIFVKTGGESKDDEFFPNAKPDFIVDDLLAAAKLIT